MKTILVVDDEHDILLTVELVLMTEGYRVIKASNGSEALARLAEMRPDLILMDVMMPVLSGLDALKKIRLDKEYKTIPVVLMSAIQPRVAQKEYNWNGFLRKPFEIDPLLDVIERLIKESRS
jgi:CheY-like chemotaxis protein